VDVDPYQALGVPPTATKSELTAAYRTMAQLFHPDRYAEAPAHVRKEAERRMKELNDAYAFARNASPVEARKVTRAKQEQRRERVRKTTPPAAPNFGVPWDVAQQERAKQSATAHAARMAREQSVHNGKAVARAKPAKQFPSTLYGMGEALHTNKVACRTCRSLEWLPAGWADQLDDLDFFCSVCDRLLISRRFGR
jgi:hypothetical protein